MNTNQFNVNNFTNVLMNMNQKQRENEINEIKNGLNTKLSSRNWIHHVSQKFDRHFGSESFSKRITNTIFQDIQNGKNFNYLEAYDSFYYVITKEILSNLIISDIGSNLINITREIYLSSVDIKESKHAKNDLLSIQSRLMDMEQSVYSELYIDSNKKETSRKIKTLLLITSFLLNKGYTDVKVELDLLMNIVDEFLLIKKGSEKQIKKVNKLVNSTLDNFE